MLPDMAYTTDHLAAIERAIASGVLSVRVGDVTTNYQSLAEMRALRDEMRADLGIQSDTRRSRIGYLRTGKGY